MLAHVNKTPVFRIKIAKVSGAKIMSRRYVGVYASFSELWVWPVRGGFHYEDHSMLSLLYILQNFWVGFLFQIVMPLYMELYVKIFLLVFTLPLVMPTHTVVISNIICVKPLHGFHFANNLIQS